MWNGCPSVDKQTFHQTSGEYLYTYPVYSHIQTETLSPVQIGLSAFTGRTQQHVL